MVQVGPKIESSDSMKRSISPTCAARLRVLVFFVVRQYGFFNGRKDYAGDVGSEQ